MNSKLALFLMAFGLLSLMTGCSDTPVQPSELPQQVQLFVKTNFPNQNITFADKDMKWFSYKYDIMLADGTEIGFDTSNEWDKIESKLNPVPAQLIPEPVATYVNANFPSIAIVKIDKERKGYEVELANGIEFKLNEQGAVTEMEN